MTTQAVGDPTRTLYVMFAPSRRSRGIIELPTRCAHCDRPVARAYDSLWYYTHFVCPETGEVLASFADRDRADVSAAVAHWIEGLETWRP